MIAGGVNSNVRLHASPVPLTFTRGEGPHLWDVDGNRYIDYAAGMGPMILGHNHPRVTAAVGECLASGQLFAGQNLLETQLAERLVGAIPWIESVRFGLSGTEMALLAVRIARAATGRPKVVRFAGHYHGWLDPLFVDVGAVGDLPGTPLLTAGQSVAAGSEIILCDWNDLDQLQRVLAAGDVACVLMEPVMCNTGLIPPAPGYLPSVAESCRRHGSLFVVDEVITGFRLGLTGAQGWYETSGDISIYAKAIASGFPLAVLGTTHDLLVAVGTGEVNHSGTYNAGLSSLAAGVATLDHLIKADPYPEMESRTRSLVEGLRRISADAGAGLTVDHIGGSFFQTRFGPSGPVSSLAELRAGSDGQLLQRFIELLQDAGVRPTSRGMWFVSAAHDDEAVDTTLTAVQESLNRLR